MPILNYDKEFSDMPDLKQEQECDRCGLVVSGHLAYYSYEPKVSILCESCHLTPATPDTANACPACCGKGYISYPNHPIKTCLHCGGTIGGIVSELSPRQREVLELFAGGHSIGETASRMGVSYRTVQSHQRDIMHKLGIRTTRRMRLLHMANKKGWLD